MGCRSCQPNESLMKRIVKMECYRMLGLQRAHRATDKETKAKRGEGCVWSQRVSWQQSWASRVPQDSAPSTYHDPTLTPAPPVLSNDKNRIRVSSPKNYFDVTRVSKHIWNGTSEDSKQCSQGDMHRPSGVFSEASGMWEAAGGRGSSFESQLHHYPDAV